MLRQPSGNLKDCDGHVRDFVDYSDVVIHRDVSSAGQISQCFLRTYQRVQMQ